MCIEYVYTIYSAEAIRASALKYGSYFRADRARLLMFASRVGTPAAATFSSSEGISFPPPSRKLV